MNKAPSSLLRLGILGIVIIVGMVGGSGSARADKPKIAVLGLEVVPGPGGTVDPTTTQVAREVTRELRARAQAGASPYMIAPNSNKELTDEKLLLSCDNEGKDCMAVIGAGLAADVLMFGRVERRGDNYKVTLKLLDVKTKNLEIRNDEMPVGGSVANVSKRLYGKLIVDAGASTINVVARSNGGPVDGGRVLVDEEKVGELANGKLTVGGVSEGRHTVAIEAGGFRRFEEAVTVRAGQPAKVEATLVSRDAAEPVAHGGSHNRIWKIGLGTGIGIGVAGGALALVGFLEQDKYQTNADRNGSGQPGDSACGKSDAELEASNPGIDAGAFNKACTWHKVNTAGFVVAGVGGVVALTSLIMLLIDHGGAEHTASRETTPNLAIVPVVTPHEAGASLSLRW